jgi:hypothetical protein
MRFTQLLRATLAGSAFAATTTLFLFVCVSFLRFSWRNELGRWAHAFAGLDAVGGGGGWWRVVLGIGLLGWLGGVVIQRTIHR